MFKVGIIGPEASGKSTLARYLADRFHGILVPELAREYIEQKGSIEVTYEELCTLARQQIDQLASFSTRNAEEVYFFDTELIITKVWFDYAFRQIPEWLEEAIHRYPMDVYLLTRPDLAWQQDGARYNGSDAIRQELFERYEQEIQALDIPYYIIAHS